MTTLIEASQALLKAAKQSVEWRLTGIGRPPEQLMQLEIEALEQAIGLELASQTASTKPVVSQNFVFLTAETVNKICATCKHRPQSIWQSLMPECLVCETYNNWELSHED